MPQGLTNSKCLCLSEPYNRLQSPNLSCKPLLRWGAKKETVLLEQRGNEELVLWVKQSTSSMVAILTQTRGGRKPHFIGARGRPPELSEVQS
jgi:hypothetical protein